jgi:hypothetical protein
MTVHGSDANSARRRSLSQKLAVASGAAAAFTGVAAPQLAEAGIIRSTTLPLSPPASNSSGTQWDVDGDGTTDFTLNNNTSTATLAEIGLARFVSPAAKASDGFAKLNAGFDVGGSMVGYKFFINAQAGMTITASGEIGRDAREQGWAFGDIGYFGFKFSNASGVHYGWGQVNIHGASNGFTVGQGFTITEAYYDDTPDASITVGDKGAASVPEIDPASAGSVLSLVMGSLAMLERRRLRRAKAAEGDATVLA